MTSEENLHRLNDVPVRVAVEIGGCTLPLAQILNLAAGSLVLLDRPAGASADVLVNGKLVGRGEIVAIDDCYGVRVTEIVQA